MTSKIINLTLPYPPLTNNLYFSIVRNGKIFRVPSGDLKKFKKEVMQICRAKRVRPFIGDVAISLKVFRPRRIGDIDGTFKALIDGLSGWAFYDDKQISWLHAERFEDKRRPRVEVQIWARSLL